jgi:Uma2 family endonuclease
MSVVLEAKAQPENLPVFPAEQHLLLYGGWDFYQQLLDARGDQCPGLRITFDRGRIELMTISSIHDRLKFLFGQILLIALEELRISYFGVGQATVGRSDLERSCEPDVWFYMGETARRMRGLPKLNFDRDPPPDLAVEIEISRTFLDRIDILAAMGVREVWRFDTENLRFLQLQADGSYVEQPTSVFLPTLPANEILRVIDESDEKEDLVLFLDFREWVKKNLVSTASPAPPSAP